MLWIGASVWFYAGYMLDHRRRAAAGADRCALALESAAADAEVAAAGRGRARRRQPDSVAAPHVRRRRGADALARAGHRARRHGRESYNSIVDWMDTALNPDLFVAGSQNLSDRTFRFPKTLASAIGAILASRISRRCRSFRLTVGGTPVMLIAIDVASFERRGHRALGGRRRPRGMYQAGERGRGRDRVGQLRAASAAERSAIASTWRRRAALLQPADRRHHHRLVGSAGHRVSSIARCSNATGTTTRSTSFRVYVAPGHRSARR